jgi:hypothetical protein
MATGISVLWQRSCSVTQKNMPVMCGAFTTCDWLTHTKATKKLIKIIDTWPHPGSGVQGRPACTSAGWRVPRMTKLKVNWWMGELELSWPHDLIPWFDIKFKWQCIWVCMYPYCKIVISGSRCGSAVKWWKWENKWIQEARVRAPPRATSLKKRVYIIFANVSVDRV